MMTAKRRLLQKNRAINADAGGGVPPVVILPQTEALIARFSTFAPTANHKLAINQVFTDLIDGGVFTDLIHFAPVSGFAGDVQAATRNWVQDLYNLTVVGTLPLNNIAFTGDGNVGNYLDSGMNPAPDASLLNSVGVGIEIMTLPSVNKEIAGQAGSSNLRFGSGAAVASTLNGRINDGAGTDMATDALPARLLGTREGANLVNIYKSGIDIGGKTTGSSTMTSANILFGRGGFSAVDAAYRALVIMRAPTPMKALVIDQALAKYYQTMGV